MIEHPDIRRDNTPRGWNEGICHITDISRDVFEPWLAEVRTDLSERFMVLDPLVLARCVEARDTKRAVYSFARYSRRPFSKRILYRVLLMPAPDAQDWSCVKCGALVLRERDLFDCKACHFVMRSQYQEWPLLASNGPNTPAA